MGDENVVFGERDDGRKETVSLSVCENDDLSVNIRTDDGEGGAQINAHGYRKQPFKKIHGLFWRDRQREREKERERERMHKTTQSHYNPKGVHYYTNGYKEDKQLGKEIKRTKR